MSLGTSNEMRSTKSTPPKASGRYSYSGSLRAASVSGSSTKGLPSPATAKSCMSAATKRWRYLRRLFHYRQMDFEFAFWQMIYLLVSPKKVYKDFAYRKHTKSQFARDDPAFLVLLSGFLVVSSAGLTLVLGLSFIQYILFLIYVIMVDVIGAGIITATALWFFTNRYMIKPTVRHQEDVEWGFCFDVHLNAFFPVLVVLHCVQVLFYHAFLGQDWWTATFSSNSLWLVALIYYIYITFLGYNSLGILDNTRIFLFPMAPVILFILGATFLDWNLCKSLMWFYHYRLL